MSDEDRRKRQRKALAGDAQAAVQVERDMARTGDGVQPCQRVSYFNRPGPDKNYAFTHTKPRLIPYEMVHDIGEEGFAEGAWSAI